MLSIVKMLSRIVVYGFVLVAILLSLSFGEDLVEDGEDVEEYIPLRLPNDTRPITYDLHLKTNVHKCELDYSGNMVVRLEVVNDTDEIVLHAKNFSQIKVNLVDAVDGTQFENVTYKTDNVTSFLTIYSDPLPLELKAGKEYILTIAYKAYLGTEARGFFRTKYSTAQYKGVCFAITDFEPTNARYAFPCYDEPAFKAKFTIAITHGSNYTAVASMPVDGEPIVSKNGMITTKFKQTPPMSPYYIAFGVIKHDSISSNETHVPQRIYSPLGSKTKGEFALAIATDTIKALEDYLEIDFSLPKIDHISVNKRFGQAMENWGLIVYDHEHLLSQSNISNLFNFRVAVVVSHELAHQWFGNLVSPKWWSYIWLSEGLTTFYSQKALSMIRPEWKVLDYFLHADWSYAVYHAVSSQPITKYAETDKDIEARFGVECYETAAYIIHMFENALTEKTFKKGVIKYLKKLQYSVADEDDLFDSLQAAASEDRLEFFAEDGVVSRMMKTWTHLQGYPVVTVTRDYENGSFTLEQQKFTTSEGAELDPAELWYIPITYATASVPDFENTTLDLVFPNIRNITITPQYKPLLENDWVILNKKQAGVYRVQYDERNWELIIKALRENPKAIHSYNKAQLIRDAATFATTKSLPEKIFFELLDCVKDEDDAVVWQSIERSLYAIHTNLTGLGKDELFNYFVRGYVKGMFNRVYENPPDGRVLSEYVRGLLFTLACHVDLEECLKACQELFNEIVSNQSHMDSLYTVEVFAQVFKQAKEEDFESLLKLFEKADDTQRQASLIMGLVMSENMKLLEYLAENLIMKSDEDEEESSEEEDDYYASGKKLYRKYLEEGARRFAG